MKLCMILATMMCVGSALADEPLTLDTTKAYSTPDQDQWTVRLQPRVWYVGPAGDLKLPGAPAGTKATTLSDLDVDSPRLSAFADITVREPKSGWFFTASGIGVSIDHGSLAPRATQLGTLAIAANDRLSTEVEWNVFQFTFGKPFKVFDFDDAAKENRLALSWQAGLRTHDQSFSVTGPGGTVESNKFFAELVGGVKVDVQLFEDFSAEIDVMAGIWPTGRSVLSADIAVGFTYRPIDALGVHFGYRLMIVDTQSGSGTGEYHYDGSLAGLFAGVSVRF